ncbi:MAG: hypothetical protein AABY15_00320 [Nanoarchaeota archaeon]
MKRNKKTERYKDFLKLESQLSINWEAQRKLGYKPLDKPIHHGYDAYWVLRDDVSRRDDAWQWQYILDNFGKSTWCRDKSFRYWNKQERMMVNIRPSFKDIDFNKYENLPPWAKKFFYATEKKGYWGQMYKVYSVGIFDYYLKMKVVKSYKTHYKVIDELLKQEEAELEARLEGQFYDERRKSWNRHRSGKDWRTIFNRADRRHNKNALKVNIDFLDDEESCKDFKYYHKHYGRWWF